jgi:hypothetical protein
VKGGGRLSAASIQSEVPSIVIPMVVGVAVAIFSVWLTEWAIRRRFTNLEVSIVLLSHYEHPTIELRFKNVGMNEARDCFAEWLQFDDRDSERILEHHPLNWSDNVTGNFVRTIFPHQTAYIQFTGTTVQLSPDYSNQIIKSKLPFTYGTASVIDIEVSWHSGQVSRMQLCYLWNADGGSLLEDAWIDSAVDRTFIRRNKFGRHNLTLANNGRLMD